MLFLGIPLGRTLSRASIPVEKSVGKMAQIPVVELATFYKR